MQRVAALIPGALLHLDGGEVFSVDLFLHMRLALPFTHNR